MEPIFLSIVIPAYNEAGRIIPTLESINSYLKSKTYSYEIIVVDDGSTDKTIQVVENFKKTNHNITILQNNKNTGKGFSVKKGVLSANGKYILFTDADLSTPIEELDRFLPLIKFEYDVVIASRAVKESKLKMRQEWWREFMGRIFNLIVQILILQGIKDTQCGFKLFKKEPAKKMSQLQKINGFAFDVELLLICKKFNYKIKEQGVKWVNSRDSKVHPIFHSIQMFRDLWRILLYNLQGDYK